MVLLLNQRSNEKMMLRYRRARLCSDTESFHLPFKVTTENSFYSVKSVVLSMKVKRGNRHKTNILDMNVFITLVIEALFL